VRPRGSEGRWRVLIDGTAGAESHDSRRDAVDAMAKSVEHHAFMCVTARYQVEVDGRGLANGIVRMRCEKGSAIHETTYQVTPVT
jgi:hypothetical protein